MITRRLPPRLVGFLLVLLLSVSVDAQQPGQHEDADRAPFLNLYIGRYQLTEGFFLDVTRVGDALYVQATGQPPTQLRPRSQTEFVLVGSNLRLTFEINPLTEEVDYLIFEQSGLGRRAEKLDASDALDALAAPRAREAITLSTDVLARYVGTYEEQPGFAITVSLEDGQLMAGMTGQTARPMLAESETEFFYERSNATVSFEVDDDGQADRLILHQGGSDVAMNRLEP